jgi:hypothetical protein
MCTPDPAVHASGLIFSPDENFMIAGRRTLDPSKFHYIDVVASKQKIPKEVGHRIKSCKLAKTGLVQYMKTHRDGVRADLEETDWGALLATACCDGRFHGRAEGQKEFTVLISGDKPLAKMAKLDFDLQVERIPGKSQVWHFISGPEGVAAVIDLHKNGKLPFPLV